MGKRLKILMILGLIFLLSSIISGSEFGYNSLQTSSGTVTSNIYILNDSEFYHNNLTGIQGGVSGEYYHIRQSWFNELTSEIFNWITQAEGDARYLQSYTETDPYWSANWTAYNTTWSTDTDTWDTSWLSNWTAYNNTWTSTTNNSYQLMNNNTLYGNFTTSVDFCINGGNCLSSVSGGGGGTPGGANTQIQFNNAGSFDGSSKLTWVSPSVTLGDGTAEDISFKFNGNAQDYIIGLDDSADDLIIDAGTTMGTSSAIQIASNGHIGFGTAPDATYDHTFKSTPASVGMKLVSATPTSWAGFDTYASDGTKTGGFGATKTSFALATIQSGQAFDLYTGAASQALRVSSTQKMFLGGFTNAKNRLDVKGAVAIGTTYAGVNTAPTNGAIIQGNVGIGKTSVSYPLDVNGLVNSTGYISGAYTGITGNFSVGTCWMSYNGGIMYSTNCTTA